jgi:hypothetical protein
MVSIKTLMSKTGTLDDSRRLSKFVQDSADYKWAQIHRKMTAAPPTPLPKKIEHTSFFDTRSTDAQGIAELLATVGIAPLIGESIGSPMQRVHISSEIGRLNSLNVEGVPPLQSLEDIALLSKSSARRLKRQAISTRATSREENTARDEEAEERGLQRSRLAAVGRRVRERREREDDRLRRMVVRDTAESRAIRTLARREKAVYQLRAVARRMTGGNQQRAGASLLKAGVQAGEVSGLEKALRISDPVYASPSVSPGAKPLQPIGKTVPAAGSKPRKSPRLAPAASTTPFVPDLPALDEGKAEPTRISKKKSDKK